MKKIIFVIPVLFFLGLGVINHAWAQNGETYYETPYDDQGYSQEPREAGLLYPDELDDLLAPIALYPDPLIAQILPASTFVDQVDQAARFLRQYGTNVNVDNMPWDVSVKAVAHYPDVLFMMDQRYDWTVSLGQAYIEQPQDVMDAIQRLRADAMAQGNLYSTAQWQVITDDGIISIVPATPQYVYVPVYDPNVVYVEPYDPGFPFITFSTGLVIGAWLDRDCDWRHHRVYYHGWHGRGWIARSRPHINDRHGVYINPRLATVHVDRNVTRQDTGGYRQQLRTDAHRRREGRPVNRAPRPGDVRAPETGRSPAPAPAGTRPGRPQAVQPNRPEPGHERPEAGRRPTAPSALPVPAGQPATSGSRPTAPTTAGQPAGSGGRRGSTTPATPTTQTRPTAPPAPTTQTRPTAPTAPPATGQAAPVRHAPAMRPATSTPSEAPAMRDVYRGRDVQKSQPASQSGFGGYGTSRDATIYRERGQSSRQKMNQPAATPTPRPAAPAPRPAVTAPRPAAPAPSAAPRSAPPRSAPPAQRAAPAARPAAPAARPATPAGMPRQ